MRVPCATEELTPYRRMVASVLVDKLPQIRTVVNKTAETGGPYRTFEMEVLAGDDDLRTEVRRCKLTLA